MRGNVGRDWRLAELAAIAGVSGRTLQRQFLAFVGKTPRAVLREIGFEAARRELLQGAPGVKVMDVALRCGFPHCGRFSIAYRRRYGETPSQTLKRQAVVTAALGAMPSLFVPAQDRPAVAFGPIEAAVENLAVAADIADDLRTALTRAGVSVATRSGAARYHLAGAVRGSGAQAHLIIRLIDTETGRQLWAHRAEGILRDGTATAEHLAVRIAAALQPCLRLAEIEHALRKPATCLGAHDLALRAIAGRHFARCQRQCPRPRTARARDGPGSGPSARHRAGGLGACPARGLSLHAGAAAGARPKPRTGAQGEGAVQRRHGACRPRQRADAAQGVRRRRSRHPQGARHGRRIGVGLEPQRMDRRLQGRSAARRSNASRSRSTSRRTIRWRSTAWSGSAAPISRPVSTPKVRIGRSAGWPNILRQAGCIEPCARPMFSPGRGRRPAAASARCGSTILISRCRKCSGACRRCRRSQCDLVVGALQEAGLPA